MKKHWVPLAAIALGFLSGTIILAFTGQSPKDLFQALLLGASGIHLGNSTFNPRYIGEFLVQALPILLTGLSVGFAFRTGLFNLGAEGQLIMGSLAAAGAGLGFDLPPVIHVAVVLLAALVAGGLWGAIPGWLKARFNVHEVVATIMLNYIAFNFNNWAIVALFKSLDRIKTEALPSSALLKSGFLETLTQGSRLHWGILPVLLCLLAYGFLLDRTTLGYRLRAVGFNKDCAAYAGISVKRNQLFAMIIAGAWAGLAGGLLTTGTFSFGRFLPAMEGYGFDGISVALVGGGKALGIFFSGLLFGLLKAAQPLMQSSGIPKDLANIIQAAIVLCFAMKFGIQRLLRWRLEAGKP